MSGFKLTNVATPPTPAANKITVFSDLNDVGRVKYIDENGFVRILTDVESTKNILLNAAFAHAQRQIPGTLTTYSQVAARAYAADRWFMSNQNASLQYQRIDTMTTLETGLESRYYGRYKKTGSLGKWQVGQVVEGENMSHLRGKRVRLTVRMKRTVAAAMSVRLGLAQLATAGTVDVVPGYVSGAPSGTYVSAWGAVGTDPTLGTSVARLTPVALSADGGTISGAGMTCALGAAFVRYSCTFDVPVDAKNLIPMIWTDGQPAVNDELNIGQAQLTEGNEIPNWIAPDFQTDVDACRRYYSKSFNLETNPAQNAGVPGVTRGYVSVAGAVAYPIQALFAVPLRTTPAVMTFYNPVGLNAFARNSTAATDATATTISAASERGTDIQVTGLAAWTVGQSVIVHHSADVEL